MRNRKRSVTMSTDRKPGKKAKRFIQAERMKIVEYGLIGLIVLLFVFLAVHYGKNRQDPGETVEPTVLASPTPDVSIRGMNLLNALEGAGFTVERTDGAYHVTAANDIPIEMHMESDGDGIVSLSFETPLCPDPEGEASVYQALREKNRETVDALRALFDAVMPVFHRTVTDSETIVKQCQTVVEKNQSYAKQLGTYSVRILPNADVIPETVCVTLDRNP